jgi:hypothetical protein
VRLCDWAAIGCGEFPGDSIASTGPKSEVSWVAKTGLHRGGNDEILYRSVCEERKLRVVRIGINASRW